MVMVIMVVMVMMRAPRCPQLQVATHHKLGGDVFEVASEKAVASEDPGPTHHVLALWHFLVRTAQWECCGVR